jgi:hypothetical protein
MGTAWATAGRRVLDPRSATSGAIGQVKVYSDSTALGKDTEGIRKARPLLYPSIIYTKCRF